MSEKYKVWLNFGEVYLIYHVPRVGSFASTLKPGYIAYQMNVYDKKVDYQTRETQQYDDFFVKNTCLSCVSST